MTTLETKTNHPQVRELNKQSLGALAVSLQTSSVPLNLDLISIGDQTVTTNAPSTLPEHQPNQILEFELRNYRWRMPATLEEGNETEFAFRLQDSDRPKADSRIAKRWTGNSLHPVVAKIQNHINAGQWTICSVDNLSIGGAQVTTTNDVLFIPGQRGNIELYYPFTEKASKQQYEILKIQNLSESQVLNIRFSPITDEHIQFLARHLIRFEWSSYPEEFELDLSSTPWPTERISSKTEIAKRRVTVHCRILQHHVCSLDAKIRSNTVQIDEFSFNKNWSTDDQISHMIACLIPELDKTIQRIELKDPGNLNFIDALGVDYEKIGSTLILNVPATTPSQRKNSTNQQSTFSSRTQLNSSANEKYDVSWDDYGLVYDKMCAVNSSYRALVEEYKSWLKNLSKEIRYAADVGAGTGNFVIQTALALPEADIVHVDRDIVMNLFAQEKYQEAGLDNVRIKTSAIEQTNFPDESLGLITAVHSLYTLTNPESILRKMYDWLEPGGLLYVVDIGRTINTNEWSKHIFIETSKERGIAATAKYFWDARAAISANKRIEATQSSGEYWTKSHEEFREALESVGFDIKESKETYRGNSDFAICQKPINLN